MTKIRKHQVNHCELNDGEVIEVAFGEKKGFVCEGCRKLFEVDYNGNITRSPLNDANSRVILCNTYGGNVCTGFGGVRGEVAWL